MRSAVLLITVFGSAVTGARAAEDQSLLQADTAFLEAVMKSDRAAIDHLLDADFLWTASNGKTQSKAETLRDLPKSANVNETGDRKHYIYGDLADIQSSSGRTHILRVWVKRAGSWKAIVYQEVRSRETAPSVTPGADSDCENPCKMVPYQAKNSTEREVVAAYAKLETAAMAHNSPVFATLVGDEFVAANSNSDRLYNKAQRIDDFNHSTMHGMAPSPLVSARFFDFVSAVLMISEHRLDGSRPLHVTRVWVKRNGNWMESVSFQTAVTAP
jgi:hypothetical protein